MTRFERPGPDPDRGERVVAYLLGELGAPERAAFEREIAADDDLRDEVETLGRVVAKLDGLPDGTWDALDVPPLRVDPRLTPPARPPRLPRRLVLRPAVAALAALVLLVAGLGAGLLLRGGDDQATTTSATQLALTPIGSGPGTATGDVALAAGGLDEAELHVAGLPPTGSGAFYELWLLDPDGKMVALGSFRVGSDGQATIRVPLPVDPASYRFFDISRQPATGDPQHSGDSVLRGPTRS